MRTLYTIGEALIDFTAQERGALEKVVSFHKNAGGAPANVAVCAAKLGVASALITQLGNDPFGDFLVSTLEKEGVITSFIFRTDKANTALAFVSLDEHGERDFSFYRNPSADMLLTAGQMQKIPFTQGDILHFCSVDLVAAPVRHAHVAAIERARESGAMISFDPNLRYSLWKKREDLLRIVKEFLPYADIVKVSIDELYDLTGDENEERAARAFLRGETELVLVTKGKDGANAYAKQFAVAEPADLSKPVVDTTGAGDSFIGAFLTQLLKGKCYLSETDVREMLYFANRAAGDVVSKEGAIPAMPTYEAVFGKEE